MNAIAALITFLATRLGAFKAATISARIAAVSTVVLIFIGVIAVGFAAIGGLVSGISMAVSDDLSRAMSWVVPNNAVTCIVALFSAHIIRATMDYHVAILQLWARAFN